MTTLAGLPKGRICRTPKCERVAQDDSPFCRDCVVEWARQAFGGRGRSTVAHVWNLTKFTAVASALVFAFAANLAAMYAQIVYVFLPATRVTGAPPQHWDGHAQGVGSLAGLGPVEIAIVALCGLGCLWMMFAPARFWPRRRG